MTFFSGVFDLSFWQWVGVALVLTHITIAGVTIFLHRCQAHRALDLHVIPSHFFRFWLWLTTGMITKEWAAIHRKHHAKCETVDDPHSPQIYGINKVLWTGVLLYVKESRNKETMERYGHGTPDDWMERNLYTPHEKMGVTLLLLINILLFGVVPGLLYAFLPFGATYAPYDSGHVVSQLQLLLFSGLAFFMMLGALRRTPTITLDTDWLYRRFGLTVWRWTSQVIWAVWYLTSLATWTLTVQALTELRLVVRQGFLSERQASSTMAIFAVGMLAFYLAVLLIF